MYVCTLFGLIYLRFTQHRRNFVQAIEELFVQAPDTRSQRLAVYIENAEQNAHKHSEEGQKGGGHLERRGLSSRDLENFNNVESCNLAFVVLVVVVVVTA